MRHITLPATLVGQSLNADGPGWAIHEQYPGEIFVLGCRVHLNRGFTFAMLEARYAVLAQYLEDHYPELPRNIIVAVEARAAGALLSDASLRERFTPYVNRHVQAGVSRRRPLQVGWIYTVVKLAGEDVMLRVEPKTAHPLLSFYVAGHPDALVNKPGVWC